MPFQKKREPVKRDLQKYDVVIVGGHLGALLSSHLDGAIGEKASIFVAYDNPTYCYNAIRGFYEKGLFETSQVKGSPKGSISKFAASSDGIGVSQILPNENAVILKSGRKIKYDQLVIATGLKQAHNEIKGFEEAWADEEHPFHTCNNHSSWSNNSAKPFRWMHNFNGGQAIFYIPPSPYHGQLEAFNFLQTKQLWDRHNDTGRLCMDSSNFTIINADNSFCPHFADANAFITNQIASKGITTQYGQKLIEIKKNTKTAIFQDLKTGQTKERHYDHFYSLLPAKPDTLISNAKLADANGLIDVDPFTLQHKKYDNIFGFGDIANVPTTKTFYAGFNQLSVVRHNVERRLNGLEPDAKYNGLSETNFHLGYDSMTKIRHLYNGEAVGSFTTGFVAGLLNKWNTNQKKSIVSLLEFKNWGAPYYKFKKTFPSEKSSSPISLDSLKPSKKQA